MGGWKNIKDVYGKLNIEDYEINKDFNSIVPAYIKIGLVMSLTEIKIGYENFDKYVTIDNYIDQFNNNKTVAYKRLDDGMRVDNSKHWFMILNNNLWEAKKFSLDEVKDIVDNKSNPLYSIKLIT